MNFKPNKFTITASKIKFTLTCILYRICSQSIICVASIGLDIRDTILERKWNLNLT